MRSRPGPSPDTLRDHSANHIVRPVDLPNLGSVHSPLLEPVMDFRR